jgi:hypothetical protein
MNKSNYNENITGNQIALVESLIEKFITTEKLDETAATHGVLIRKRVVKSAKILLIALFTYANIAISQRVLSAIMAAIGLADMSDQAWQKKL